MRGNDDFSKIAASISLSSADVSTICENPNFNQKLYEDFLSKMKVSNQNRYILIYKNLLAQNKTDNDNIRPYDWINISNDLVKNNLELPWNLDLLKKNSKLKVSTFDNLKSTHNIYNFLSSCHLINISYILNHPEKQWNWVNLTVNKQILLEDIHNNPNLPWSGIEMRDDITLDFLINHKQMIKNEHNIYSNLNAKDLKKIISTNLKPETSLDFSALSSNPNLTWSLIKSFNDHTKLGNDLNPYSKWNLKLLSKHHNITFKIIKKYSKIGWDYNNLMLNPNLKWKNIIKYKDFFGWSNDNIRYFSGNPNMTYDIYLKYDKNFWVKDLLLTNTYKKNSYLEKIRRREIQFIFRHYFHIIENKTCNMGLFSLLPTELFDKIMFDFIDSL